MWQMLSGKMSQLQPYRCSIVTDMIINTLYGGDYQTICVICDIDLLLFINVGDQ